MRRERESDQPYLIKLINFRNPGLSKWQCDGCGAVTSARKGYHIKRPGVKFSRKTLCPVCWTILVRMNERGVYFNSICNLPDQFHRLCQEKASAGKKIKEILNDRKKRGSDQL